MERIDIEPAFISDARTVAIAQPGFALATARFFINNFSPTLFRDYQVNAPIQILRAAHRRQGEFLAGRALAQFGLRVIESPSDRIGLGSDRLPIWPKGTCGSISHARSFVACLVGSDTQRSPGIDIEAMLTLDNLPAVRRAALTENDIQVLQGDVSIRHATAIFSAKEALFKALYPSVRQRFGFDAATLDAAPNGDHLDLRLTRDLSEQALKGQVFRIEMRYAPDHVLSWLIV